MFIGSDFNKEKENILLKYSTIEDRASLTEYQDSDRESFLSPRQKKKTLQNSVKKEKN
jgi:hypothetical protein